MTFEQAKLFRFFEEIALSWAGMKLLLSLLSPERFGFEHPFLHHHNLMTLRQEDLAPDYRYLGSAGRGVLYLDYVDLNIS